MYLISSEKKYLLTADTPTRAHLIAHIITNHTDAIQKLHAMPLNNIVIDISWIPASTIQYLQDSIVDHYMHIGANPSINEPSQPHCKLSGLAANSSTIPGIHVYN